MSNPDLLAVLLNHVRNQPELYNHLLASSQVEQHAPMPAAPAQDHHVSSSAEPAPNNTSSMSLPSKTATFAGGASAHNGQRDSNPPESANGGSLRPHQQVSSSTQGELL